MLETRCKCKLVECHEDYEENVHLFQKRNESKEIHSMRYNLTSSDLLSFNDLKTENIQLGSDLSLAEETILKQN